MAKLPDYVSKAIVCGAPPKIRRWQTIKYENLTDGEKVLRFARDHLHFAEGIKRGQPLELDVFQQSFILAVFDSRQFISKGIFSLARRGGKTLLMAVILLSYIVGPLARRNTLVRSAAMTREQAGLLWRQMALICDSSPDLQGLYNSVPSGKKLVGLSKNVEYQALSRDAKAGHGQGIYVLVLDECGQIDAPNDDYIDMLFSSLGSYTDSRSFLISTQAPLDSCYLSLEIDSAIRDQPKHTVCHLYTAANDDIMHKPNWYLANPSLYGGYRSLKDIEEKAEEAMSIPAKQNGFLNLYMNRRVALENIWLAPNVWKKCGQPPDWDVFVKNGCHVGLDLSIRSDWTAAVLASQDEAGNIHLWPFTFMPSDEILGREQRDKMPYRQWLKEGVMQATPGVAISYDWVAQFLVENVINKGVEIKSVQFDRYKADEFFGACSRQGLYCEQVPVGQGFVSMHPRVEEFEVGLLEGKIFHGMHPTLNAGAASAVIVTDPAGNRKIAKNRSIGHQKIDTLVGAVMAAYPYLSQTGTEIDVLAAFG